MEKAHDTNNLTDFGKALYERLEPFKMNVFYKEGDLTQIGYRQTREIGRRMVQNYPEVFENHPYLKTNATNVLRVAATMQSVNSGILSLKPELEWAEIDNSRSFLTTLNPYGNVCPDRSTLDKYILGKENSWYKKYRSYIDEKLDVDVFFIRLFIDITQIESEYDKYDLVHRFWLMASLMQCLDRQVLSGISLQKRKYWLGQKSKTISILRRRGLNLYPTGGVGACIAHVTPSIRRICRRYCP